MNHPEHLRRDNLLWESSRMMLPEHREQLLAHQTRMKVVKTPDLDEQHLHVLAEQLTQAIELQQHVQVTCHLRNHSMTYSGTIQRLDPFSRTCTVMTDTHTTHTIRIDTIIQIEGVDLEHSPKFD